MHLPKINFLKKHIKTGAWILGIFLLLLVIAGVVAYNKREALLEKMMAKAIAKADQDYDLDVAISEYGFNGLSTVHMKNVTVVPKNRDTLTTINEITLGIKLLPLIFGNVKLSQIDMNVGKLNIVFKDTVSNLDFLLKRKKNNKEEKKSKTDLAELANNLLNQVLYKIPDNMEIKDFLIRVNDNDTAKLNFLTTKATINDGELNSTILVNGTESTWHINGTVKPGKKQLNLKLFADNKRVKLPYLENKLHVKFSFDTVQTEMKNASFSGDDYKISGSWSVKNLLFNHPKIAANDIIVKDVRIDADMLVGKNFIALDSSSTVFLRKASIHPYFKYTLGPNKIYEIKLHAPEQGAQEILSAFPQGLFESLDGMQVSGKIRYDLNFHLDTSLPDSVKFYSALTPINFKILRFGKTDLQKVNKPFVYTPYERGKPMRDIFIGPGNSNYTPLSEVSSNYKNAILTSEDPSFFTHKGFVMESIRKSIAVNFKAKKFVRGGSTISMQFVKNIFLSRQKTLSRKAEEILIVWLIENNRLVSKNRLLEVYFNIIEMGPNIYGIGEASRYYFGKKPSDLNIGEGIFLANIVPRPKIAMYKFKDNGNLKDYLYPYFKFIGKIMAGRGLTPPDSNGYGFYNVQLREGLRKYLLPDSTTIDTNDFDDDPLPAIETQDASKDLFDRLFGKKKRDSVGASSIKADTVKTKKELRQERRERRKKERELETIIQP